MYIRVLYPSLNFLPPIQLEKDICDGSLVVGLKEEKTRSARVQDKPVPWSR